LKNSRPITRIALGAVAAALLMVTTAAASGSGNVGPDVFTRTVRAHQAILRPDDRGGIHGVGAASNAGSPVLGARPDDRPGMRAVHAAPAIEKTSAASGFRWGDAGVGLGTAFALMLLTLATARVLRRERSARNT
jgi:hypothetical protein